MHRSPLLLRLQVKQTIDSCQSTVSLEEFCKLQSCRSSGYELCGKPIVQMIVQARRNRRSATSVTGLVSLQMLSSLFIISSSAGRRRPHLPSERCLCNAGTAWSDRRTVVVARFNIAQGAAHTALISIGVRPPQTPCPLVTLLTKPFDHKRCRGSCGTCLYCAITSAIYICSPDRAHRLKAKPS